MTAPPTLRDLPRTLPGLLAPLGLVAPWEAA